MQSILFSKYFLQTATEKDKEILSAKLLGFVSEENFSKATIGRGSVEEYAINNKNIFLRKFYRGGLLSKIISNTFFHLDCCQNSFCLNYRPFREMQILELLNEYQIPSPKPIAAFVKTNLANIFYQAAIATEKIEDAKNFLDLVKEYQRNPDSHLSRQITETSYKAGIIAYKILEIGVFHVDLHLGNVLINSKNDIFIIDFDRAKNITPQFKSIFRFLIKNRWKKSCTKYNISDIAVAAFNKGLNNG